MGDNKRNGILIGALAFVTSICLFTPKDASAANISARWCTSWYSTYTDSSSSGKEDWLRNTSWQHRRAQFSEYSVWKSHGSYWSLEQRGYLTYRDSGTGKYCTDVALNLEVGTLYRFRQYTQAKRGNRVYVAMSDSSSWTTPNRLYYDTDITPQSGDGPILSSSPTHTSKQINTMPIARQLLALANTFGWTDDLTEQIFVNMEPLSASNTECTRTCYSADATAILTGGGSIKKHGVCYPTSSTTFKKFVFGHELGHAVARIADAMSPTGNKADTVGVFSTGLDNRCTCHPQTSHCLQSREYIGNAVGESYAHFISTALYNNRTANAYFHYYRDVWHSSSDTDATPWINWSSPPRAAYEGWLEGHCAWAASDVAGLGTEADWGQFLWRLWAETDAGQLTIPEINDIWHSTDLNGRCCASTTDCSYLPDPSDSSKCTNPSHTRATFGAVWDARPGVHNDMNYLVDTAESKFGLGSDKLFRFNNLASTTKVNF